MIYGTFTTTSLVETQVLAANIEKEVSIGDVIALMGTLGTGKTTFTQGFAKAMGISAPVSSPTFKLVSEYKGKNKMLYHIDCYRLNNVQQFINIGGEEYLSSEYGITIIEWADIIKEILPVNTIMITFNRKMDKPDFREITVSQNS